MSKELIKKIAIQAAKNQVVSGMMSFLRKNNVPVFMLHRMQDKERGVEGHSPEFLRASLQYLKDSGYSFISLETLIDAIDGKTKIPPNSVAFTMDDGFLEQIAVACPIFKEFSCPVSIFLISDFSSGLLWPWDYKIEYIINKTSLKSVKICNKHLSFEGGLSTEQGKERAIRSIRDQLKLKPSSITENTVQALAQELNVKVTNDAPDQYTPISWELARKTESGLIRFGPHGKSHAILSSLPLEECIEEISESTNKLKDELTNPLPVFCYPTGRIDLDFGKREMDIAAGQEFRAALSVSPGYVDTENNGSLDRRFCLPRFGMPDNMEDLIQLCSWIEVAKEKFRRN